jgi:hypothetical protein
LSDQLKVTSKGDGAEQDLVLPGQSRALLDKKQSSRGDGGTSGVQFDNLKAQKELWAHHYCFIALGNSSSCHNSFRLYMYSSAP